MGFSISGEFITNTARELYEAGNHAQAARLVQAGFGHALSLKEINAVIGGSARIVSINHTEFQIIEETPEYRTFVSSNWGKRKSLDSLD